MKFTYKNKTYNISNQFQFKSEWFYKLGSKGGTVTTDIEESPSGYSAFECFFALESLGVKLPCRELFELKKYLTGKWAHGITVTDVARAFSIDRVITTEEIKRDYPSWVVKEIFARAEQVALDEIGFVPTFIKQQLDYSELEKIPQYQEMQKELEDFRKRVEQQEKDNLH